MHPMRGGLNVAEAGNSSHGPVGFDYPLEGWWINLRKTWGARDKYNRTKAGILNSFLSVK